MISPDGRWLAYVSNESERDEVYVRALLDGDDRRWQVSVRGGREPVWSASGDELFYRADGAMMAVTVTATDPPSYDVPVQLFSDNFAVDRTAYNQYYDVASDGRFLMIQEERDNRSGDHLHLVFNFDRLLVQAAAAADSERRRQ